MSLCTSYFNLQLYSHLLITYGCLLKKLMKPLTIKRGKKPVYLRAPPDFLKQMCQPCLVIIQSCYFDHRINKPFACSRCLICVSCSAHSTCAKDHGLFPLESTGQKIWSRERSDGTCFRLSTFHLLGSKEAILWWSPSVGPNRRHEHQGRRPQEDC